MRPCAVAFSATMFLVGRLVAQSAPPTPESISESQFLAALDEADPAWLALGQNSALAEANALAVRSLANLEFTAAHESPGDGEQLDVTLSWQLPHLGKRQLAIAAAHAAVDAARAHLVVDRSALRLAQREVFARWAVATEASARLATWVEQLEMLARRERARASSGETAGLNARRLELAASVARGQRSRAEAERLAAVAAVRAWRPNLAAEVVPVLPPLAGVAVEGLPEHPRTTALRAELTAARLEAEVTSKVVEMPRVVGGWQRQNSAGLVAEGPTVGLVWAVPLLDRQPGQRAAARARVVGLESQLAVAQRELAADLVGANGSYDELRAAAEAAAGAASEVPAILTAATSAFRAGETTLTDLLETLDAVTQAQLAALALHADALAAQRRLQALAPNLNNPILPSGN